MTAVCGHPLTWTRMYRGTYDLITPESYGHPAKASPALIYRILEHLEETGLLKSGATILDPMSGTGLINICAGAKGYASISVELEPKFIAFQQTNKDYAERKLHRKLDWTIIQGDSRYLSSLLSERGLVTVVSPPYQDVNSDNRKTFNDTCIRNNRLKSIGIAYSDNPANIGNLPDRPITIMSPPYIECGEVHSVDNLSLGIGRKDGKHRGGSMAESHDLLQAKGQIGNLPDKPLVSIMSPPYSDAQGHPSLGSVNKDNWGNEGKDITARRGVTGDYGQTPGQIGALPDKPITVMSPPYADSTVTQDKRFLVKHSADCKSGRAKGSGGLGHDLEAADLYGQSEGQIGQEKSENYLSAMALVYAEIGHVSNVLAIVLKNPTRNGQIRRLDLDTIKILEATGWTIHCRHEATLFEEHEQTDLFGESKKKVKGRMSFFRRLAWQKGSPRAQWEDILIAIRRE